MATRFVDRAPTRSTDGARVRAGRPHPQQATRPKHEHQAVLDTRLRLFSTRSWSLLPDVGPVVAGGCPPPTAPLSGSGVAVKASTAAQGLGATHTGATESPNAPAESVGCGASASGTNTGSSEQRCEELLPRIEPRPAQSKLVIGETAKFATSTSRGRVEVEGGSSWPSRGTFGRGFGSDAM